MWKTVKEIQSAEVILNSGLEKQINSNKKTV